LYKAMKINLIQVLPILKLDIEQGWNF